MQIILASGSPRRQQLLTQAGIDFIVSTVSIDESWQHDETSSAYILRMVQQKTTASLLTLGSQFSLPSVSANIQAIPVAVAQPLAAKLLLTADTIGVLPNEPPNQQVLLKPRDRADAFAMWQRMSGNTHEVWTAVQCSLILSGQLCWQQHLIEKTKVKFVPLTVAQMRSYWDSGEPQDKAGGYAIQGRAAAWVERIEGSYTNVVGLPLAQTLAMIEAAQRHLSLSVSFTH